MIKLKTFKQSKGYCGPASLKMVLSAYGINKSEDYLARLTKSSRTKGCGEMNMIIAARKFGFNGYVKQKSSMNELKSLVNKGIPVIVDWYSPEEGGHYSVVVGFKGNNLFLADSHFGKIRKHKIKNFEDKWFDVVNDKLILREIIVVKR